MRLDQYVIDDDGALRELASAYGVATEYWDWRNEHVLVRTETLIAVLRALDVDARHPRVVPRRADRSPRSQPWRRCCRRTSCVRTGEQRTVDVHVPHGASVDVWVTLEDGTHHANLRQLDNHDATGRDRRALGRRGQLRAAGRPAARLPHAARVQRRRAARDAADRHAGLARPARAARRPQGVGPGDPALQRAVAPVLGRRRSHRSGRPGHLGGRRARRRLRARQPAARRRADRRRCEPSPYLPTSRRFANPLYLRIDRIPEFAHLDGATRDKIDRLGADVAAHRRPHRSRRGMDGQACRAATDPPARPASRARAGLPGVLPARGRARSTTSPPGARSARSTARTGTTWPAELQPPAQPGGGRVRRSSTSATSISTAGCSGCSTSSWPTPRRRRAGRAWRSASSTTWPSASARPAPTRGPGRTTWRRA